MEKTAYRCRASYDSTRFDGAVIACSDGRFGSHCEEFAQTVLGWSQYDRVFVPGGPARLLARKRRRIESDIMKDDLQFLIHAHKLTRIVLIAHGDCMFYTRVLKVPVHRVEAVQLADLAIAAEILWRARPTLGIEGYYANVLNGGIEFEEVRLSPLAGPLVRA